jgi:hypothetical protein
MSFTLKESTAHYIIIAILLVSIVLLGIVAYKLMNKQPSAQPTTGTGSGGEYYSRITLPDTEEQYRYITIPDQL